MIPSQKKIDLFKKTCKIKIMKLRAWIEKEKNGKSTEVVCRQLAKEVKRSWRYIYFISLGAERPGQDLAVKLVIATNGEVGLFDLLPHLKEAL
jgi:hypothetical protein